MFLICSRFVPDSVTGTITLTNNMPLIFNKWHLFSNNMPLIFNNPYLLRNNPALFRNNLGLLELEESVDAFS